MSFENDSASTITKITNLSFAGTEWTLLFQGAESRVFEGVHNSQAAIMKERFQKLYRLPELDRKLTKERIKSEIKAYMKIIEKCENLKKHMPSILYSDERNIIFSRVENASTLNEYIVECEKDNKKQPEFIRNILIQLAELVAEIHSSGLIHGDLTTSNFLVKKNKNNSISSITIVPIDFGLSYSSTTDENRAVDLYVLERALQSTHPGLDFGIFLDSYQKKMGTDKINKKLDQVRMRGRKRLMIG